ncbi:hypothetical protein PABG_11778 [Paracoccidioides brasiliensis Pb03]|nr:hypothetical protein PABG_11778 [Paracoccidioides brasiliensis Pb03]
MIQPFEILGRTQPLGLRAMAGPGSAGSDWLEQAASREKFDLGAAGVADIINGPPFQGLDHGVLFKMPRVSHLRSSSPDKQPKPAFPLQKRTTCPLDQSIVP